MVQDNLLIDTQNPTAMYQSANNILSEVISGVAYKNIYMREHMYMQSIILAYTYHIQVIYIYIGR